MRKRTGLLLLGGGVILALGVAVGAAFLMSDSTDEPSRSVAQATETVIDPYRQWGIESGDLPAVSVPITTPPNAPMEYAPLDAAYLSSLAAPAEGQLIGTVVSIEPGRAAVIRADSLEIVDAAGAAPVLRVLQSGVRVTASFGDALDPQQARTLAEGDVVFATVRLEPGSPGTGSIVIQSYNSAP